MKIKVNKMDIMNRLIYENLARILKNLNKRIHIKIYALVYDNKQTLIETIRVKKTVPNGENLVSISQDKLQTIMNVYAELKIEPINEGSTYDDIKNYIDHIWYKQNQEKDTNSDGKLTKDTSSVWELTMPLPHIEGAQIVSEKKPINDNRILYVNRIPFQVKKSTYSVIYILEMRNIEYETRKLFYANPEISFLRMLLDYFFDDFFALTNSAVKINNDDSISRKYNEDGIQFNRRITRLFFGKMQNYLQNQTKLSDFGSEFDNQLRNEYYVNSLLEKMDDISALTYENANPFGSILFINKEVITDQSIIRFTVKFTKEDRIGLEDAKRIRKLLELTNVDKDLFLIADEKEIYGLGEVNWSLQKDELVMRLDFTGLSKYNLFVVRTETELVTSGKLLIAGEKKVYRSDLSLIEMKLVSVSFKNPKLGEEGYSSEKFTQLLKNTFWKNHTSHDQIEYKVERLDQIVRKAREQKHGTMVVITEKLTAQHELYQLSKQSTLIEPRIINPEYIKYLTAIDGAIYFDTDGFCHAIGVILDGTAKEDIGDASRGARYNSAYRYLHKLKDNEQKRCVIVIISEDGMVDLIPESEHEDMLLALAEEIIDMINEESCDSNKLKEKEDSLLQSKIVDFDWLFNVAKVYYDNKDYKKAIDFLKYGITMAERSFILPIYYNLLGNSYHLEKEYLKAIDMYNLAIVGADEDNSKHIFMSNIGGSYLALAVKLKIDNKKFEDEVNKALEWSSQAIDLSTNRSFNTLVSNYIIRGSARMELSDIEGDPNRKKQLLKHAIEDYSNAIEITSEDKYFYWSRFCVYYRLNQVKEAIEDLIQAEYIEHDDWYINKLSNLLEKEHSNIVTDSIKFYNNLVIQKEGPPPPQLVELIVKYQTRAEISKQEEAAVSRALDLGGNKN